MPQYEYSNDTDSEVIVLLRPMAEADDKVDDPAGRGRKFHRRLSTFAVSGTQSPSAAASGHVHTGSCCPCGKPQSSCGNR